LQPDGRFGAGNISLIDVLRVITPICFVALAAGGRGHLVVVAAGNRQRAGADDCLALTRRVTPVC
jgi:hypothetical protein